MKIQLGAKLVNRRTQLAKKTITNSTKVRYLSIYLEFAFCYAKCVKETIKMLAMCRDECSERIII